MKKLITILVFLISLISFSQDVISDNKGNVLFSVPLSKFQGQVSLSKLELGTRIGRFGIRRYYIPDVDTKITGSSDTRLFTMQKSFMPFMKVGLVSNTESALKIRGKLDLSPTFETGISYGFDSLLNPSYKKGTYWAFSLSYTGKFQGLDFYDTISKTFLGKSKRWSSGIKGFATVFFGTYMAFTLSGSIERSIVTDDLTSYQKRSNTFYYDNQISSNGKADGYFSPVNPTNNYRLSLSIPYFIGAIRKDSNALARRYPLIVAPYYFGIFSNASLPNHNVGVTLSFLDAKFRRFDVDFHNNPLKKRNEGYVFKQALTLGLNLISTNQKNPIYAFISGTFDISRIKWKAKADPNDKPLEPSKLREIKND